MPRSNMQRTPGTETREEWRLLRVDMNRRERRGNRARLKKKQGQYFVHEKRQNAHITGSGVNEKSRRPTGLVTETHKKKSKREK